MPAAPSLVATSDLHVDFGENRKLVEKLRPRSERDWLLVAGDVAAHADDVVATLLTLRERFATVVWTPGNHELWTLPDDPVPLRGEARYRHLVAACRRHGVVTPEDPYPVWEGGGELLLVVPVFLLYDYSFRPAGTTKEQALAAAEAASIVCADEHLLHPDPHPTREAWCAARVEATLARLEALPRELRTVLVSHYPLRRDLVARLRYPQFAPWCGTERTADWHRRFRASVVVSGHLHVRSTRRIDGARFEEVSLGYPYEWRRRGPSPQILWQVDPPPAELEAAAGR